MNKTASAVELRVHVPKLELPEAVAAKLLAKASKNGVLVVDARRFKSQLRNRDDALARLDAMIAKAYETPKKRRPTKPTKASGERRLTAKKSRAGIKRGRGRVEI